MIKIDQNFIYLIAVIASFIALISLIFITPRYYLLKSGNYELKRFKFPRILPWTIAAQIRKTKAKAELAHAETILYEVEHTKLQKRLVLTDLQDQEYRAITEKSEG